MVRIERVAKWWGWSVGEAQITAASFRLDSREESTKNQLLRTLYIVAYLGTNNINSACLKNDCSIGLCSFIDRLE